MTHPDVPVAGPLHTWLMANGDLLEVALVVAALLSVLVWFAAHDLRAEAADRAAGAGNVEGAGWFWDFAEPPGGEPAADAAPAEPTPAAARGSRQGHPEVRTKVA